MPINSNFNLSIKYLLLKPTGYKEVLEKFTFKFLHCYNILAKYNYNE